MKSGTLVSTVQTLLSPGKGLLAADESFPTIEKRFEEYDIPSTETTRRDYREMLFATPQLGRAISGAILFDETLRQKTARGPSMVALLAAQGIVPGIKVDAGTTSLAGSSAEKFTQGLDSLRERLAEYRSLGARFTKWRAVISIAPRHPSQRAIETNSWSLASFAALSQEAGLVPIVEPEVLMDGRHSLERCEEVTTHLLHHVFAALFEQRVELENILLKTGMILSGKEDDQQASTAEITAATIRCFRRTVPAAVPGIVFLSGGQTSRQATTRLDALCRVQGLPWKLSFSFGRALQATALKVWQGNPQKVKEAQRALAACAHENGAAVARQAASRGATERHR